MRKEEETETQDKNGKVKVEERPSRDGHVFLFTGYMINNSKKKESHFPPEREQDIKRAINAILDKHHAGPDDIAVTTGMDAGSELIFVECCAELGIPVRAHFPTTEAPYVRDFVSPCGEQWVERFYKMRNHPLVDEFYQPEQVGPAKDGDNIHERNNRWALYSALVRGIDKVRLIALWDGKNELSRDLDARLVKHMVDLMRDTGGMIEHINPLKLSAVLTEEVQPKLEMAKEPASVSVKKPRQKTTAKKKK